MVEMSAYRFFRQQAKRQLKLASKIHLYVYSKFNCNHEDKIKSD